MTTTTTSRFCSVCARQAGLSPAGYGGAAYEIFIAAELPLPWPRLMFGDSARMPPEILAVMQHIREEYERDHTLRIRPLGIAPAPDYSVAGMRRVIGWHRPTGPLAQFNRSEYLAPEEQLGPLVYALALAPERLDAFATHGSVDAACSKFGYPAYAQLRRIRRRLGRSTAGLAHHPLWRPCLCADADRHAAWQLLGLYRT